MNDEITTAGTDEAGAAEAAVAAFHKFPMRMPKHLYGQLQQIAAGQPVNQLLLLYVQHGITAGLTLPPVEPKAPKAPAQPQIVFGQAVKVRSEPGLWIVEEVTANGRFKVTNSIETFVLPRGSIVIPKAKGDTSVEPVAEGAVDAA